MTLRAVQFRPGGLEPPATRSNVPFISRQAKSGRMQRAADTVTTQHTARATGPLVWVL